MSVTHTVYLGPYARTPVGPGPDLGDAMFAVSPGSGGPRDGYLYWMPNRYGCGRTFDRHDDPAAVDVAGVAVGECGEFMRRYADAVDALRKHYGEDAVDVVWGVVSYFS